MLEMANPRQRSTIKTKVLTGSNYIRAEKEIQSSGMFDLKSSKFQKDLNFAPVHAWTASFLHGLYFKKT
jgi:hypothetical protein